MAVFAEPLEFVLIAIGAKTEIFGNARVKPAEGIWEGNGAQRFDAITIAESDKTGARSLTFIE